MGAQQGLWCYCGEAEAVRLLWTSGWGRNFCENNSVSYWTNFISLERSCARRNSSKELAQSRQLCRASFSASVLQRIANTANTMHNPQFPDLHNSRHFSECGYGFKKRHSRTIGPALTSSSNVGGASTAAGSSTKRRRSARSRRNGLARIQPRWPARPLRATLVELELGGDFASEAASFLIQVGTNGIRPGPGPVEPPWASRGLRDNFGWSDINFSASVAVLKIAAQDATLFKNTLEFLRKLSLRATC